MNNQFYLRDLSELETLSFHAALETEWGVTNNYWYPLRPINRTDVISFNAEEFERKFGFNTLREVINEMEIFEIKEWRDLGKQINMDFFKTQYDGEGEGYWFPKDLKWIIYCSHENSISIGGEEIVKSIKSKWKEWEDYIW
ncbi:hypothetical protein ACX1C1_19640 [Paenibacillus sp. strain BS8-2]